MRTDDSAGLIFKHNHSSGEAAHQRFMAPGAAVGDYDGDGWLDVYLCNGWNYPNTLYRNLGDGTFRNVTYEVGADVALLQRESMSALFIDYDGDGRLDLFVGNEGDVVDPPPATLQHHLFRNVGNGQFEDVTVATQIPSHTYWDIAGTFGYSLTAGLSAGDLNGDGYLDIYVAYWLDKDQLLLNNAGMSFTDIGEAAGIAVPFKDSFTPLMWDANGDGRLDIHVTVDFTEDLMFLNQGGPQPTFVNVAAESGLDTVMNEMGSALADYDNDGDMDLYCTNIEEPHEVVGTDGPVTAWNRFFRNDTQKGELSFTDVGPELGVHRTGWGWGVTFADYNHDGWQDLFVVNGNPSQKIVYEQDPSRAFRNEGGTFTDVSDVVGFNDTRIGRSVIAFDYDRDGDQDLLVTNYLEDALLYRNDGGHTSGNWLVVQPVGLGPNRDGIGATVRLEQGAEQQTRLITAGTSFISQEPAEAHFGVGKSSVIDTIRVEWPDGTETEVHGAAANTRVNVRQGVMGLTIAGPTVIAANSTVSYSATLTHTDGSILDVTQSASWSVAAQTDGAIVSPGLVEAFALTGQESAELTLQVGFEQWTATLNVGIVDPDDADTLAPTVVIVTPTTDPVLTVAEDTITLSGTATDDGDIVALLWSNDRGGGGPCLGIANWSSGPISLHEGENLITVTALDSVRNEGQAEVTVVYERVTGPVVGEPPVDSNDNVVAEPPVLPANDNFAEPGPVDEEPSEPVLPPVDTGQPVSIENSNESKSEEPPASSSSNVAGRQGSSSSTTCGALGMMIVSITTAGLWLLGRVPFGRRID